LLAVVLMALSTVAFAQSDAQKSFDKMKTLGGLWEGHVTTLPLAADIEGKPMQSVASRDFHGNAHHA